MVRVYTEHCPQNVPKVDTILQGWAGREDEIIPALYGKYENNNTVGEKSGSSKSDSSKSGSSKEKGASSGSNKRSSESRSSSNAKRSRSRSSTAATTSVDPSKEERHIAEKEGRDQEKKAKEKEKAKAKQKEKPLKERQSNCDISRRSSRSSRSSNSTTDMSASKRRSSRSSTKSDSSRSHWSAKHRERQQENKGTVAQGKERKRQGRSPTTASEPQLEQRCADEVPLPSLQSQAYGPSLQSQAYGPSLQSQAYGPSLQTSVKEWSKDSDREDSAQEDSGESPKKKKKRAAAVPQEKTAQLKKPGTKKASSRTAAALRFLEEGGAKGREENREEPARYDLGRGGAEDVLLVKDRVVEELMRRYRRHCSTDSGNGGGDSGMMQQRLHEFLRVQKTPKVQTQGQQEGHCMYIGLLRCLLCSPTVTAPVTKSKGSKLKGAEEAKNPLGPADEMRLVVLLRALVVSKLLTSVLDDPLNQPMIILAACGHAGGGGGSSRRGGGSGRKRARGDDGEDDRGPTLFAYLQQQLTLGKASSSQQYCSEICLMQLVSALGLVVLVLQEDNKDNNTGQCFEADASTAPGYHYDGGAPGAATTATGDGAEDGMLLLPKNFIVMANSRRSHIVPFKLWLAGAGASANDSAGADSSGAGTSAVGVRSVAAAAGAGCETDAEGAVRAKQLQRIERQLGKGKGKGKGRGKSKSNDEDGENLIGDALEPGGGCEAAATIFAKVGYSTG
jgi:hypothetical protein